MTNHEVIFAKLEEIQKDVVDGRVKLTRIEGHMETMNGKLVRHEDDIKDLKDDTKKNTLAVGKIYAVTGSIVTVFGLFSVWIGNKIFGGK